MPGINNGAEPVLGQVDDNGSVLLQLPAKASMDSSTHGTMLPKQVPDISFPPNILDCSSNMTTPAIYQSLIDTTWTGNGDSADPYFDYTAFARPWDYNINHSDDASDWFSTQFMAAMRETELAYSSPTQGWNGTTLEHPSLHVATASLVEGTSARDVRTFNSATSFHIEQGVSDADTSPERLVSATPRASSPPNEVSHEDCVPFAWDPKSKPIARAKPITLRPDDPIFTTINPRFTISDTKLSEMCEFLRCREPLSQTEDSFTIPSLSLVNVFISLFFKHFLHQAPVLHTQTVDINTLPSALLAIITVIGSGYSRLRNTRRFGIVVFDRTRRNLQHAIEEDNNLMRDPLTVYALTLVCFVGLWCGNKRAFELAEALQATLVTYIRHLPNDQGYQDAALNGKESIQPSDREQPLLSEWTRWVTTESRKRLRWLVYTLDSQFCSLLGTSSMMTLADVRNWELPCDEDFWSAPTARSWKNLLGSASQPSCPIFGPLAALFLSLPESFDNREASEIRFPRMNNWSAKLLLGAIMAKVFQYEQTVVVFRMIEEDSAACGAQLSHTTQMRPQLYRSLELWHDAYMDDPSSTRTCLTSSYFQRASKILYYLIRIYLMLPLTDIQDCLGRAGLTNAAAAMARLRVWTTQYPDDANCVALDAAMCIGFIMSTEEDTAPYDMIALFLCHLALWIFANTTSLLQKEETARKIREKHLVCEKVCDFIEAGFATRDARERGRVVEGHESQLIFKHAIQVLVRLGTWGASSNLALLLHLRQDAMK